MLAISIGFVRKSQVSAASVESSPSHIPRELFVNDASSELAS